MGFIEGFNNVLWGYLLVFLLLGVGIYLTYILRGLQFKQLGPALYLALIKRKEATEEGDISHFQALMTALAATVGTGNIVGVATAIAAGGPGALFWMWITALFGMATKYSEALLGVKYRHVDAAGERSGGPAFYLTNGIGGPVGRVLGLLFALFAAVAAFGIGNMVQSNAAATQINNIVPAIPKWTIGVVLMVLAGAVILGGIKSIGRFTGFFVPFMAVFYMIAATVVLIVNIDRVPAAIGLVISDAFTGTAATGGFLGAGVAAAIRFGIARGLFSNESGLGTGGIAAAAAQTTTPVRQALVSMTQTFIDTIVICSFTGLAIISTGVWTESDDPGELTQLAFGASIGTIGPVLVAVGLAFFAFSTLLGWAYYGERNLEYLFGRVAVVPYRLLFIVAILIGTVRELEGLFLISDLMNGMMALPNLVGLLLLSGVVLRETRAYFNGEGTSEPRVR